jgi:hypothetical protein
MFLEALSREPRDGDHVLVKRRGDPPELLSVSSRRFRVTRPAEPPNAAAKAVSRRKTLGVARIRGRSASGDNTFSPVRRQRRDPDEAVGTVSPFGCGHPRASATAERTPA